MASAYLDSQVLAHTPDTVAHKVVERQEVRLLAFRCHRRCFLTVGHRRVGAKPVEATPAPREHACKQMLQSLEQHFGWSELHETE